VPARLAAIAREAPTIDLNAIVAANIGLLVAGLALALLISIVWLVVQWRRLGRLDLRLQDLTRGSDGESLEGVLNWYFDAVGRVADDVDKLAGRTATLESLGPRALQRIGLVRFNPFEDTGGNQSFALALLDARDDGFVISSLHTRTGTRIYAKALSGGRADGALSDEETEAVAMARGPADGHGMPSARLADGVRQVAGRPARTSPAPGP
jgi:hypothetical protein